MPPEIRKFLFDVPQACEHIETFVRDRSLENYQDDNLLRSGVERQLMIVGEALHQAYKIDPSLEKHVSQLRQIINFRHVIVHAYGIVEDETVWGIVQTHLPIVRDEVRARLQAEG